MAIKKWAVGFFLLLAVSVTGSVLAQTNAKEWLRFDVRLNLQQNSGLNVEEVHQVALTGGATEFVRVIPTDKLERVENLQVSQLGPSQRGFVQADSGADYTFEVKPLSDSELAVTLHFPPNNAASTTFVLRYFAVGAVRFYNTGDQLDWRPFGAEAPGPINSATIEIRLPPGFSKEQLQPGHSGGPVEQFVPEDNRVEFKATNVAAGDNLEVTLKFPHGIIQGSPPAWQQRADSLELWSPIFLWGSLLLAVFLLILGPAAAYGWWFWRLRLEPPAKQIPRYIKTPPSKLPPAVAGMLLEGKSSPKQITATLLELASRGAIYAYPGEGDASFLAETGGSESEPVFYLYGVDQSKALRPFEETLYTKIFGFQGGRKRNLAEMRRILFMAGPEIKTQIEADVTRANLFSETSNNVRRQYLAFGGAAILMSLIIGLLALVIFSRFSFMVICPFLSLMVGAGAFIMAGYAAPRYTVKGQKHAVRWEAFRRYLKDLDAKSAQEVRTRFSQLLPHAVALGVDKEFVKKFVAAQAPAPPWWDIPPERRPDTSHQDAHAWLSSGQMSQSGMPKQRSKSTIHRLGTSSQVPEGVLLKDIQPEFEAFLQLATEVFAKAPAMDEDEASNFELTGGQK